LGSPAVAGLGPPRGLAAHAGCCLTRRLALLLALGLPQAVPAAEAPLVAQSQLGVAGVLQGIISYTAWPAPHDPLQLCITRTAPEAAEIARLAPLQAGPRRFEPVMVDANQSLPAGCDVLYADGWSTQALRAVLTALAFRPVLTVGRGPDFCTDGGMFCLEADDKGGTRFEVNLDAIARSGLRVHPQVLRLARAAPKGA
jgi:YfiR/HmsC-like